MKKTFPVIGLLVIIIFVRCSKNANDNIGTTPIPPVTNCNGAEVKFSTDINPVIQSSCATNSSCHGNGSGNGPGALTNFNQIKNAAASIKNAVQSGRMPKGSSLTAAQIQSIACWVNAGSTNN